MTSPLRGDEQKPSEKNDLDAVSEHRREKIPEQVSTVVDKRGRIVIPAPYRKTLGIKEGDAVFIRLEGEELHIVSDETEVRRVREMIDRYAPEGVSLVDELIRERRREAAAEEEWSRQHLSDYGKSETMKDVLGNESVNLTDQKS